jgi:putative inorganic carbon (HCO3(-)) transporter
MELNMPIAMILGLQGGIPILLYVGGMIAFLLAACWRPQLGLYFLVTLLPLQTVRYHLHEYVLGDQFVDVVLLGIILGLLFRRDGTGFIKTPLTRYFVLLGVFLYISLWMGSSYLGAANPLSISDPRVSDWKNYLELPLLFVVVASTVRDTKQMKILILLMGLSFLMVNRSFYTTVNDRDFSTFSYDVRDAGVVGYAGVNGLAAFEAQFMLFLLSIYTFQKQKWIKLGILGVVLTGIYCLLYSFSRGGYLAFLVGLMFLGILKERKILLAMLVLLIAWQVLLPTSVQQRVSMTYDQHGQLDASAQTRVDLWQDAMTLFRDNPVLGTGFNTYAYLGRVGYYTDTHNYYLKVMVETGVIGLLLFLWLVWRMFALGFRLFRTAEDPFLQALGLGFAVMMIGAVVLNLFGDRWTYMQVNGFLWVLLGCVVRGQMILQRAQQETETVVTPIPALQTHASRPRLA